MESLEVDHLASALPDALFQAPDADAIDLLHLLRQDRPKVLYQVQVWAVRRPVLDDVGELLPEHHGCSRSKFMGFGAVLLEDPFLILEQVRGEQIIHILTSPVHLLQQRLQNVVSVKVAVERGLLLPSHLLVGRAISVRSRPEIPQVVPSEVDLKWMVLVKFRETFSSLRRINSRSSICRLLIDPMS